MWTHQHSPHRPTVKLKPFRVFQTQPLITTLLPVVSRRSFGLVQLETNGFKDVLALLAFSLDNGVRRASSSSRCTQAHPAKHMPASVQQLQHPAPPLRPHAHFTHSTFLQRECTECVRGRLCSPLKGGGGVLTDHMNQKACLLHRVGWCLRACVSCVFSVQRRDKYRM